MESLKKFKNKQINGNSVFGGQWVSTYSQSTNAQGCTVQTEDSFYDSNGDGIWGAGENGSSCTSINCK